MKPKPNVLMEHLNIYGRQKRCAYIMHYNMHKRQKNEGHKNNLNINKTKLLVHSSL